MTLRSLYDLSREIFPEAFAEASEFEWRKDLLDYETELGDGDPSRDRLRFWSAFLRRRKKAFAETAAREWARAEASLSPQDDSRGEGANVLLNPTLQVVTNRDRMLAFWRVDGAVTSCELDWQQAAVIDEMREAPRMARATLVHEMSSQEFALEKRTPFETVIAQMIQDGLILLRG